jgi:hypothetical protein
MPLVPPWAFPAALLGLKMQLIQLRTYGSDVEIKECEAEIRRIEAMKH